MKGDNSALYDNKKTVFVGNLPFDVKVRYLRMNVSYCSNQPFFSEARNDFVHFLAG